MNARFALAALLIVGTASTANAQSMFGGRSVGGGVSGSSGRGTGGVSMQQSGQLQSENAIQRSMLGGNTTSLLTPSIGGGAVGGLGGLGGVGMGGMGVGGLGMGGYGMGMGGYGMGMGMGGLGMGGMGGMNRRGMGNFGNQFGRGQQNQRQINAPLRLGFTPVRISPTVTSTRFTDRLTRLPAVRDAGQVNASMTADGVMVLQGVVATEYHRDLIERLAMLEPGVDEVLNELEIDPAIATATASP